MAATTTQRIVIGVASLFLLAGCTSTAEVPTSSASAGVADPATAGASAAAEEPAPAEAPETPEAAAGPRPVPSVTITPAPVSATAECEAPTLDEAADGTLGDVDIEVVRDGGSRAGAAGTVTTATDGTPASYLVASGDISEQIADRFCVSADYLDALNSVRRDGVNIDDLYAGDTLNLSPTTVLSVGDQNGRVRDNAEPDPLPEQAG